MGAKIQIFLVDFRLKKNIWIFAPKINNKIYNLGQFWVQKFKYFWSWLSKIFVAFREDKSSQISSKDVRKWQSGKIEISLGTKKEGKTIAVAAKKGSSQKVEICLPLIYFVLFLCGNNFEHRIWRQKEIPLRHFWWWQWNVFSSNNANFLSPSL